VRNLLFVLDVLSEPPSVPFLARSLREKWAGDYPSATSSGLANVSGACGPV